MPRSAAGRAARRASRWRNRSPEIRALPALLGDVEDDAVGILELALEAFLLGVVAEVEEELAAQRLDPLLRLGEVVDLKAEVVRPDVVLRVVEARAALAEVVEQREVDYAVAEVDGRREVERLLADAFEAEDAFVELRRLLEVAHDHGDVPQPGGHLPSSSCTGGTTGLPSLIFMRLRASSAL